MTTQSSGKPMMQVLQGKTLPVPPVWLMRQAGRYLPEYRELRRQQKGFWDLVYNPDLACAVTLQPVKRFGMDAAILFSDILVIPQALGQEVVFVEERGPVLDPLRDRAALGRLSFDRFQEHLAPVYETLRLTRAALAGSNTVLIGFSGAPWTLACYMVEGGSSRDFTTVKTWAYGDPEGFGRLIDLLTEAVIAYCLEQIRAGAEVIQLFDSWAGILDHTLFARHVIAPARRIAEALNEAAPHVPVIGFPRGAGRLALDYAQHSFVNAIALDQQIAPHWAASVFQPLMPVQGNMDPVCLLTGGRVMRDAADDILSHLAAKPFIFNLGHGVIKETPPDHVAQLVDFIRTWKP